MKARLAHQRDPACVPPPHFMDRSYRFGLLVSLSGPCLRPILGMLQPSIILSGHISLKLYYLLSQNEVLTYLARKLLVLIGVFSLAGGRWRVQIGSEQGRAGGICLLWFN